MEAPEKYEPFYPATYELLKQACTKALTRDASSTHNTRELEGEIAVMAFITLAMTFKDGAISPKDAAEYVQDFSEILDALPERLPGIDQSSRFALINLRDKLSTFSTQHLLT